MTPIKRYLALLFLLVLSHSAFAGSGYPPGVSVHGTITTGDCASFYNGTTIQDSGAACGGGGGMTYPSGTGIAVVSGGVTWGTTLPYGLTGNSTIVETNSSGLISASIVPTLNQNTTGNAANVTGTSNSTITALSALSLPYSQLTSTPTLPANTSATSNQFFTAYNSSTGAFTAAQPSFSNISGTPSTTQVPFQSLTTTGTSGAATLSSGVLNIPQYSGGSGTVNSGTQYQLGYYAATGTAISGASNIYTDSTGNLYLPNAVGVSVGTSSAPTYSLNIMSPTSNMIYAKTSGSVANWFLGVSGTGTQLLNFVRFNDITNGSLNVASFGDIGFTVANATPTVSTGSELYIRSTGVSVGTTTLVTNAVLTINGHVGFNNTAPTVSSCGSGTLATGSADNKGQITSITAATACTITFGSALPTAPACTFSSSVSGIIPTVTSLSTTSVTTSMTALTGTLYYICF